MFRTQGGIGDHLGFAGNVIISAGLTGTTPWVPLTNAARLALVVAINGLVSSTVGISVQFQAADTIGGTNPENAGAARTFDTVADEQVVQVLELDPATLEQGKVAVRAVITAADNVTGAAIFALNNLRFSG